MLRPLDLNYPQREYVFEHRMSPNHSGWAALFPANADEIVDPAKIVPQGQFGVLHDIFDHAALGHSFNRAGEVRAFGAMFYRHALSGGADQYARELAGVIGGDIWNWQEDESYNGTPYISYHALEQFKLLSWELLDRLGWPTNLSPRACHTYLCQGFERASQWWNGDQYGAADRMRSTMEMIPAPWLHSTGTRLHVHLGGGFARTVTVEVKAPEIAHPGTPV